MKSRKKTFDCVEMKRRGAERIHEATKGLTLEQKIDYWRRQSEQFRREIGQRTPESPTTRTHGQENPGT
jgi:hypothetical protein